MKIDVVKFVLNPETDESFQEYYFNKGPLKLCCEAMERSEIIDIYEAEDWSEDQEKYEFALYKTEEYQDYDDEHTISTQEPISSCPFCGDTLEVRTTKIEAPQTQREIYKQYLELNEAYKKTDSIKERENIEKEISFVQKQITSFGDDYFCLRKHLKNLENRRF